MSYHYKKQPGESTRSSLSDEVQSTSELLRQSLPQDYRSWWHKKGNWLLYAIIAGQFIALSIAVLDRVTKDPVPQIYSPARDSVSYDMVTSTPYFDNRSPYLGTDTKRVDKLWEDLYDSGMISVISKNEAGKLLNETRAAPKTPNLYLVQLQVFHDLHCLNLIRKWVYMDVYPGQAEWINGTLNHDDRNAMHVDHCIDALRQSIMCTSDITPRKFAPHKNERQYYVYPDIYVTQTCRNYEAIKDWADERRVVEWMMSFDDEWQRTRFDTAAN